MTKMNIFDLMTVRTERAVVKCYVNDVYENKFKWFEGLLHYECVCVCV